MQCPKNPVSCWYASADELAAMVMPQLEALHHAGGEAAAPGAYPLTDHFQRFEAITTLRGVDADTLRGAVIDGDEDGGIAPPYASWWQWRPCPT